MEWLEEQCIRLNASQGRERENKAKGIIEEAKQKIQEEFGDPDIGLEKIAAEVGLTQTYFFQLVQKRDRHEFRRVSDGHQNERSHAAFKRDK